MSAGWRIGIDLGGTKIEGLLLDADGAERARERLPTPRDDYPGTVRAITAVVGRLQADAEMPASVGIGTPGTWVPARRVMKNCNSTWLNGRALLDDLRASLGSGVAMANDANCFALSEAVDGAAAGAGVVFGVILGTGVGGGLIVERRVVAGANGLGGEWGHTPLPGLAADAEPRPCYCSRNNCVETWLSGPGLERSWRAAGGEQLAATAIAARAGAGDELAVRVFSEYVRLLGTALAQLVNIIDPDVIVLGGGLSRIEALYRDVPGVLRAHVFTDEPGELVTRLVPPLHGDASGVRGAAWLPDARAYNASAAGEQ